MRPIQVVVCLHCDAETSSVTKAKRAKWIDIVQAEASESYDCDGYEEPGVYWTHLGCCPNESCREDHELLSLLTESNE